MTSYFALNTPQSAPLPPLRERIDCDALVIGGGICGILTAHLLKERGLDVVLLEASRLLGGQTRGTTAKVTVQHGAFAEKFLRAVGRERARAYVDANRHAVDALEALSSRCGADCGFERVPAFVYTLTDPDALAREAESCAQLGLHVEQTRRLPAPILPAAALCMEAQAQMNPLPLLHALAGPLRAFEHSRVIALNGLCARTAQGSVRAKAVAVCTNYPAFTLPGAYFLRLYQQRAYVLALRDAQPVGGILYGIGPGTYSLRSAGEAVFLGGESHRCGDAQTASGCYERLRGAAKRLFPGAQEAAHWSAQDCMTMDGMPYVGRYSARMPGVYVATGFSKWGMSNAMAAAQILADAITGRETLFAWAFSPQRLPGASACAALAGQAGHACAGLGASLLPPPLRTAESLAPGEGAIVRDGLHKRAAYRDDQGALHAISPYCAHMRCLLRFNPSERSWDCPCHGSRFSVDGELLCGPAQHGQPAANRD